jgi:hypothetical protein
VTQRQGRGKSGREYRMMTRRARVADRIPMSQIQPRDWRADAATFSTGVRGSCEGLGGYRAEKNASLTFGFSVASGGVSGVVDSYKNRRPVREKKNSRIGLARNCSAPVDSVELEAFEVGDDDDEVRSVIVFGWDALVLAAVVVVEVLVDEVDVEVLIVVVDVEGIVVVVVVVVVVVGVVVCGVVEVEVLVVVGVSVDEVSGGGVVVEVDVDVGAAIRVVVDVDVDVVVVGGIVVAVVVVVGVDEVVDVVVGAVGEAVLVGAAVDEEGREDVVVSVEVDGVVVDDEVVDEPTAVAVAGPGDVPCSSSSS